MSARAAVHGDTAPTGAWAEILPLVRWYPSPHNSQPLRVRILDAHRAELYYDLDRGLPAEPYGDTFGFVCAGSFLELIAIAAHALGFDVAADLRTDDMDFVAADRLHPLGTVTLTPAAGPIADLDPALVVRRRTARTAYLPGPVDPDAIAEVADEAHRWGHHLESSTDPELVQRIVAINQRTLFDDLADPAVRREIAAWLRYTPEEAARHADGLSAECLGVPGPLLRWFVTRHRLWSLPVLGDVARAVYLRTMRGVSQLVWITGPFGTNADAVAAGRMFIRIWLRLTAHDIAVHPFGSVITNARSHRALCDAVDADQRDGMTWMLLRVGYSAPPPRSHRRPVTDMLVDPGVAP